MDYSVFNEFISKGYYDLLKREERDVKDVMMMDADKRTVKDVGLIREYLKQYCSEFQVY
mgnify:CR=1 FL=1|jgi:hypothetical protein